MALNAKLLISKSRNLLKYIIVGIWNTISTLKDRMSGLLRLVLVIFECQTRAVLSLEVENMRSLVTSILCILEV